MRVPFSAIALTTAVFVLVLVFRVVAAVDVGQVGPKLVVQELDGHDFDLGAMRGRVVIVNLWATWCPPCRKEMPALDSFYRRFHGRGLEMIGLSLDRPRDRGDVVKVMRSFSYPAAMLDDAKDNDFGTPSELPVTFIIDENGIVRARLTPEETPVTEQSLDQVVVPLLQNQPKTEASPSIRPRTP
jgi:cytochrome c biogenesis protein CcmG, thiol:disulfide interchange protein DsbE